MLVVAFCSIAGAIKIESAQNQVAPLPNSASPPSVDNSMDSGGDDQPIIAGNKPHLPTVQENENDSLEDDRVICVSSENETPVALYMLANTDENVIEDNAEEFMNSIQTEVHAEEKKRKDEELTKRAIVYGQVKKVIANKKVTLSSNYQAAINEKGHFAIEMISLFVMKYLMEVFVNEKTNLKEVDWVGTVQMFFDDIEGKYKIANAIIKKEIKLPDRYQELFDNAANDDKKIQLLADKIAEAIFEDFVVNVVDDDTNLSEVNWVEVAQQYFVKQLSQQVVGDAMANVVAVPE